MELHSSLWGRKSYRLCNYSKVYLRHRDLLNYQIDLLKVDFLENLLFLFFHDFLIQELFFLQNGNFKKL
jgi:hypothetical protein